MTASDTQSTAAGLVSGIIVFLNGERYLEEAIESVFAQTSKHWELLLVDDGSTDGSTEIAQKYAQRHPEQVRYLEHPGHENRGMSATRNLGIRHARGEFIAFLDADDVWLPRKLEEQVPLLQSHPEAALLYGRTEIWFSWSGQPEDLGRDYLTHLGIEADRLHYPPGPLPRVLRYDHDLPCTCSVLIRRAIIEPLGGYEESFRHQYEDIIFYSKVFLRHPVYVSSKCWDRYRQHPESTCAITTRLGLYSEHAPNPTRGAFLNWLAAYLERTRCQHPVLRRTLARQRWPYRHPRLYANIQRVRAGGMRLRQHTESVASKVARFCLPLSLRRKVWAGLTGNPYVPPIGTVRFGDLRRPQPISSRSDRGMPIDTFFVERFLSDRSNDIRGHVVELGRLGLARRFGHGKSIASLRTIEVGELESAPDSEFGEADCILAPQTLQRIFNVRNAIASLAKMLKPGGVALVTLPGIYGGGRPADDEPPRYWTFTTVSAARLFSEFFAEKDLTVEAYGSALSATAFLHGLGSEDLRVSELLHREPGCEVVIAVRVAKPVERS